MGEWLNANRKLADPYQSKWHNGARALINAIGKEWGKRRQAAELVGEDFAWPDTTSRTGRGGFDIGDAPTTGLLKFMGYTVGSTAGEPQFIRRHILSEMFSGELPPYHSPEHMREWGKPGTSGRLKKLANTIASLARIQKQKQSASIDAIRDWEADLAFLHAKYYVGIFGFAWPKSHT